MSTERALRTTSLQPLVHAPEMVAVQARQQPKLLANPEVFHANGTAAARDITIVFASMRASASCAGWREEADGCCCFNQDYADSGSLLSLDGLCMLANWTWGPFHCGVELPRMEAVCRPISTGCWPCASPVLQRLLHDVLARRAWTVLNTPATLCCHAVPK